MRAVFSLLSVVIAGFIAFGGWWHFNQPKPVALEYSEPFPSVSFAPFRRGQGPIAKIYPTPEQVEEDLKSLVGVAKGIRTYTAREGLEVVPPKAQELGLQVTHSAWLGREDDINQAEVAALIKAANDYPEAISRVIVGNEVLLRQDLTAAELVQHIKTVKAAIKQPVSYADVWAFYLKNPEVGEAVDYITIHILPYWEDEPLGVEKAADHIVKIYKLVQERFPNKQILIGEAGWPTSGRNRGPAQVNMENAALFVRTLAQVSKENGFDYNVVEAFDQPWKQKLEGTVGGFWGIMDQDRKPKYSMSGPVQDNPNWARWAALSVVLGAFAVVGYTRRGDLYRPDRFFVLAAFGQALSAMVVWQAYNALLISYSTPQDIWAVIRIALHAVFAVLIIRQAAIWLADDVEPVLSRRGERITVVYGTCAMFASVWLFVNGRYFDIPNLEFLVPCFGLLGLGLIRMWRGKNWGQAFAVGHIFAGDKASHFIPAKFYFWMLVLSAVLAPLSEALALWLGVDFQDMYPTWGEQLPLMWAILWDNGEILVWGLMALLMSIPYLAEWRVNQKA